MNKEGIIDISTAEARSINYGRLAQAFVYPGEGQESLISKVDYTEAFDPAASPVACSIREYTYNQDIHATSLNEELLRFYQYFGLGRAPGALMPDHISVELEFMQFLNQLQAAAEKRDEDLTPLKKAQRDFLERHLQILVRGAQSAFRTDIQACKALVDMAEEIVASDLERLKEEVGLARHSAA